MTVEIFDQLLQLQICSRVPWMRHFSINCKHLARKSRTKFRNLMWSYYTEWKEVSQELNVDHNLETIPLEIRTIGAVWSNKRLYVLFKSADDKGAGGIDIRFGSKVQYRLPYCHSNSPTQLVNFPTSLSHSIGANFPLRWFFKNTVRFSSVCFLSSKLYFVSCKLYTIVDLNEK
jgi:hypothetical protein